MGLFLPLDTDLRREAEAIDHLITVAGSGIAFLTPVTAAGPGRPIIPRSLTTTFAPGEVTITVNRRDLAGTRALIAGVGSFTISPEGEPNLEPTPTSPPSTRGGRTS